MHCNIDCQKLIAGNQYIFRVSAQNKYGVGPPTESAPVVAKNQFGISRCLHVITDDSWWIENYNVCIVFIDVPSAPGKPEITKTTSNSMMVAWERPQFDGGNEIIGYHLERRTKSGLKWIR